MASLQFLRYLAPATLRPFAYIHLLFLAVGPGIEASGSELSEASPYSACKRSSAVRLAASMLSRRAFSRSRACDSVAKNAHVHIHEMGPTTPESLPGRNTSAAAEFQSQWHCSSLPFKRTRICAVPKSASRIARLGVGLCSGGSGLRQSHGAPGACIAK